MKTIRYYILFILFTFGAVVSLAQVKEDSIINRNITIEREYRPVIQDAGKINSLPFFIEPKVAKTTPEYTTNFSKPLNVDHNIHYLSSAELVYKKPKSKDGFARVGIGTGFNSLADLAVPLVKKSDMKLDFRLNHYGLFNSKAHSTTQAALAFDKKFKAVDFYAGISGRHEYFKYYGHNFNYKDSIINFVDLAADNAWDGYTFKPTYNLQNQTNINALAGLPEKNNLWRLNVNTGIQTSPATDNFRYGVHLNYDLFNAQNGITEQTIDLAANFDAELFSNRIGVNINSQNLLYSTSNNELEAALQNYYVLSLNPYYSFEKERWDLRLGLKSSFSFVHGRSFSPSPDIHFEWRAVPKFLAIYAGAVGDYQINSLNNIYLENRFLNPDVLVNDTYIPADFYLGVKIKPATGLLFDAYIDYKFMKDQYFFVNKEYKEDETNIPPGFTTESTNLYTNRFEAIYSDAGRFKVGGRISYNYSNKFNIQFSGAYNHWNVSDFEYAWNKPAWEIDFSTDVRITPKLNVYGNMGFAGKRYALINNTAIEMKTKVDINLGASYAIKDWLSAFLKINNLVNNKYEQWHGYEVQGFNVMGGAIFNF